MQVVLLNFILYEQHGDTSSAKGKEIWARPSDIQLQLFKKKSNIELLSKSMYLAHALFVCTVWSHEPVFFHLDFIELASFTFLFISILSI